MYECRVALMIFGGIKRASKGSPAVPALSPLTFISPPLPLFSYPHLPWPFLIGPYVLWLTVPRVYKATLTAVLEAESGMQSSLDQAVSRMLALRGIHPVRKSLYKISPKKRVICANEIQALQHCQEQAAKQPKIAPSFVKY